MSYLSVISSLVSSAVHYGAFAQIIIVLPLALDIAGKDCFLALSAALACYYSFTATTRLIVRNTRLAPLAALFPLLQHLAIPALLLLCFNLYSSDDIAASLAWDALWKTDSTSGWPGRAMWAFGRVVKKTPGVWEKVLRFLGPVFVLLEGISTLMCIQTLGFVSRYYVESVSEVYQFVFLIGSSATYVGSAYFLYECYDYAAKEPLSATFIGVSVSSVVWLSGIAFAVRKGNVVETSLMMGYTVFNIFYLSNDGPSPLSLLTRTLAPSASPLPPAPPLPPILLHSFTALLHFLSSTFGHAIELASVLSSALPLPVFIGLVYRLFVLYAASRTVLALKRQKEGWDETVRLSEEDLGTRTTTILLSYSRVILIGVYTHLLLVDNEGHQVFWRWLNIFLTIALWGVEIMLESDDESGGWDTLAAGGGFKLHSD